MQHKTLLILAAVTAAAVAGAALSVHERNRTVGLEPRGPLYPDLADDAVNQVASITLQKGEDTLELELGEEGWTVASRGGYPAKFESVKRLAVGVQNLQIEEPKTSNPTYHERLGVLDPGAEGSESMRVTLKDAAGKVLADLIAGRTEYRGSKPKTYVRKAGENQVYLCDGRLTGSPRLTEWVDTVALRLETDRVQRVQITHADGEVIQLGRSPENHTQFIIENLPPGREERYEGVATAVASALASLSFDDVRPADEIDFQADPVAQTRYEAHDGLVVVVETARADGKTWARIHASYEQPPAPPPTEQAAGADEETASAGEGAEAAPSPASAVESEGEGAPEEAVAQTDEEPAEEDQGPDPEEVRKEAEELAERLSPWAFALPSYKADLRARHRQDRLTELPEPEESQAEGGNPSELGDDASSTEDTGASAGG